MYAAKTGEQKMEYEMTIAGLKRSLPMFPISDDLYIAAFIMLGDTEITVRCAEELLKKAPAHDIILTAECKGIPLAYEMAKQESGEYMVARKGEKLYMKDVIRVETDSITTSGKQELCLGGDDAKRLSGKKVLIVDDVISTGSSLESLEKLVSAAGGIVAAKMAVLAEGGAADRGDIIFLEKLPLFDRNGKAV